jgi:hypothetical protein
VVRHAPANFSIEWQMAGSAVGQPFTHGLVYLNQSFELDSRSAQWFKQGRNLATPGGAIKGIFAELANPRDCQQLPDSEAGSLTNPVSPQSSFSALIARVG